MDKLVVTINIREGIISLVHHPKQEKVSFGHLAVTMTISMLEEWVSLVLDHPKQEKASFDHLVISEPDIHHKSTNLKEITLILVTFSF